MIKNHLDIRRPYVHNKLHIELKFGFLNRGGAPIF